MENMKISDLVSSSSQVVGTIPVGTIIPSIFNSAPEGWLECSGQEVAIGSVGSIYYALSQQLGTTYGALTNGSGGVGSTHFRVPNLKSSYLVPKVSTDNVNSGGLNNHQHFVNAAANSSATAVNHNHNIGQSNYGGDYWAHNHSGGPSYAGANGTNPPNVNKTGTGGTGAAGGAGHIHDANSYAATNWWSNTNGAYSYHNIDSLGIGSAYSASHTHSSSASNSNSISSNTSNTVSFPHSYVVRYLIKV
jgi:microcystin-dependent protein